MNNTQSVLDSVEKDFDELLSHYKNLHESTNYAVNEMRRKPNSVLEAEIKSFLHSFAQELIEAVAQDSMEGKRDEGLPSFPYKSQEEKDNYFFNLGRRSLQEGLNKLTVK